MTAPDRIWAGFRGVNVEQVDRDDVEYIRRDPAVIARDETVLAMVGAVIEEAASGFADDSNLDMRLCCNGHHCGCQGATAQSYVAWQLRALTPADAAAALAARDKRIRDEALEEAAKVAWDAANTSNADAEDAHQRGMSEGAFHLRQEAEAFARVAAAIRALKGAKP